MKGLVAAVAAVTVGAVVLGATIAARRGPEEQSLSAPPAPLSPGPTKITLSVPGLAQGESPRIPYLVGREVRGGGDAVTVPGVEDILEFTRVGGAVLAVTTTDTDGSRVQRLNAGGTAVVQGADHLVANEDHSAAAYAAYQGGTSPTEGGIVFADTGTALQSLRLSKGWNFRVLAYADGKVLVAAISGADTIRPTAAIVRCTIIIGACELAAPSTRDHLLLAR